MFQNIPKEYCPRLGRYIPKQVDGRLDVLPRVERLTDKAKIRSSDAKLFKAENGATQSHMHTQESKCYITGKVTRQVIAHNPPKLVLQTVNKLVPDRAGNLVAIPESVALAVDKRDSLDIVPSVLVAKPARDWIKNKRKGAKQAAQNIVDKRRESV